MSFAWPDPIGFVADVVAIIGIPVLYVATRSLFKEVMEVREPKSVSFGCLEFNDVDGRCGVNLVPLEQVTAIPRVGDQLYLPGETHDSKSYGRGYYDVLKIQFCYQEASEVDQPCPALPSKVIVDVRLKRHG